MLSHLGLLFPLIPIEILLSTKGLMFLLLSAYGGAMWTFLSGAPRVHTILVPDLDRAKKFYEEHLKLPEAELPLQYYYGYEQPLVGSGFDAAYFPGDITAGRRYGYTPPTATPPPVDSPGLWYQLSDNVQLHVIPGSPEVPDPLRDLAKPVGSGGYGAATTTQIRHTSFDRDTIKALLKYFVKQKVSHSVRSEKPLTFWVRDGANQIVEFAEVSA